MLQVFFSSVRSGSSCQIYFMTLSKPGLANWWSLTLCSYSLGIQPSPSALCASTTQEQISSACWGWFCDARNLKQFMISQLLHEIVTCAGLWLDLVVWQALNIFSTFNVMMNIWLKVAVSQMVWKYSRIKPIAVLLIVNSSYRDDQSSWH